MKVKIVKSLIVDDKNFNVGDDIAFTVWNTETNYNDRYIVKIVSINESICDNYGNNMEGFIQATNIEKNRDRIIGTRRFFFKDMMNCNYVYDT